MLCILELKNTFPQSYCMTSPSNKGHFPWNIQNDVTEYWLKELVIAVLKNVILEYDIKEQIL